MSRIPTRRSRLGRARDLSSAAWRTRNATFSQASTETKRQEAARLVRLQLSEAVALCREAGADRDLADVLRRLGHAEQDAGRGEAATASYEESVAAARRTGDPRLLAHAIRHLGDVHRSTRRLAAAKTCYAEALAIYAEHADLPVLDHANALRPTAILKEALGETAEARRLWQRARALYASVAVSDGVAECEESLSRIGHPRPARRGSDRHSADD